VGIRSSWSWISLCGGLAALWLGLTAAAHGQSGTETENDGPHGVAVVGSYAQLYWAGGDFAALDRYFEEMAQPTERFEDGGSHLMGVSHGLGLTIGASTTRKDWERSLDQIRAWRQKNPQSAAVDIVEAQILRLWAWTARGRNSRAVAPEGQKLFEERLQRAEEVLFRSKDRASNNPLWYLEYLNIARARNWNPAEFHALYAAAIDRFPDFDPFYFEMIRYLDPDWDGDIQQIEAYIAEATRQTESRQGKIMCARLYWYLAYTRNQSFSLFEDSAANWADIKTGFEQLIAATPKSLWNLNNFASLACRAGDADTYRKLRKQIGKRIYNASWPDNYTPEICDERLLKTL